MLIRSVGGVNTPFLCGMFFTVERKRTMNQMRLLITLTMVFTLSIGTVGMAMAQASKELTNSIGMEFPKSWSDSVDFGSPPLVRAAGL
jgi:hypothetical protein